jgi:hypothetical protein
MHGELPAAAAGRIGRALTPSPEKSLYVPPACRKSKNKNTNDANTSEWRQ